MTINKVTNISFNAFALYDIICVKIYKIRVEI